MIDTHAHLEPEEAGEVLDRARAAGVSRVVTVATTIDGAREALSVATENAACTRASGSIRTRPAGRSPPAGRASRAVCRPARRRGRRDRARLLPRLCAARRAATSVRGAPRARLGARQARRDPHSRSRRRHRPRALRLRRHGDPPLLLVAGAARPGARARVVRVVRRQRDLPEGTRAARGRRARSRPAAFSPRPTARTSRRSLSAGGGTSRPSSCTRSRRSPRLAATTRTHSRRRSTPTRARHSGCDGRPEEAARPALPGRREHPRRHRAPGRPRPDRRRPGDRARARGADALPRRTRLLGARRRDRPLARAGPPGDPADDAPLGRRAGAGSSLARSPSREACREPSLQRRDPACRREPRPLSGDRVSGA